MSLRDQLLAKGLVSKKDARRVTQELKHERRSEQGNKQRKAVLAAEEQKRVAEERERATAERLAARRAAESEKERHERAIRAHQILVGNQVKSTGPLPFWFRSRDGRTVLRLGVQRQVAEALRDGRLAIAWLDRGNRGEYVLIRASGAERLAELAPELLVHVATGPVAPGDGLYARDWEPTIPAPGAAPRRVHGSGAT